MERFENRFLLAVRQGDDNVFTVTFRDIILEVHMYNYGNTEHFWVDGNYDLRFIDYWLGIINEKYSSLEEYCNDEEIALSKLSQFRPLRYYNSVPEKYMADSDFVEYTTAESAEIFLSFTREVSDMSLCKYIEKHCISFKTEKRIAKLLTKPGHSAVVNHIIGKIQQASAAYPEREYGEKTDEYRIIYNNVVSEVENYVSQNVKVRVVK